MYLSLKPKAVIFKINYIIKGKENLFGFFPSD